MKVIRGKIFTLNSQFEYGEIEINHSRIFRVTFLDREELTEEEQDRLIIPGLVDIHTHGCFGHDT